MRGPLDFQARSGFSGARCCFGKALFAACAVALGTPAASFADEGPASDAVCPAALAASQEAAPSAGTGEPRPIYRYSLEHSGSLGFIAGISGNYESLEKSTCPACETSEVVTGWDGSLDLAATLAVGWEGAELVLRFSLTRLGEKPGESLSLGFRHYFGKDEWKTFLSLEAVGVIRPLGAGGLRGGFGAAWDFSPVFGVWAEFSASIALGEGRLFGARLGVGIQARTYLF